MVFWLFHLAPYFQDLSSYSLYCCFFFFTWWITFHCIPMQILQHFTYPLISWWVFGLLPLFGYYGWCRYEHLCTCFCVDIFFHFSWVFHLGVELLGLLMHFYFFCIYLGTLSPSWKQFLNTTNNIKSAVICDWCLKSLLHFPFGTIMFSELLDLSLLLIFNPSFLSKLLKCLNPTSKFLHLWPLR